MLRELEDVVRLLHDDFSKALKFTDHFNDPLNSSATSSAKKNAAAHSALHSSIGLDRNTMNDSKDINRTKQADKTWEDVGKNGRVNNLNGILIGGE